MINLLLACDIIRGGGGGGGAEDDPVGAAVMEVSGCQTDWMSS